MASGGALFSRSIGLVIAGLFAISAFGVALISGLASDNPASSVLARAIMALFLSYPVGWIVGMICQYVIDDHLKIHKEANPALDSMVEFPVNQQMTNKDDDDEIITVGYNLKNLCVARFWCYSSRGASAMDGRWANG